MLKVAAPNQDEWQEAGGELVSIRRGEIYYVYLDPVFGRELGGYKTRPVVVLSINEINTKPLVVTVVPGTSDKGHGVVYRNVVRVEPTKENGACRARPCSNAIKSVHSTRAGSPGSRLDSSPTLTSLGLKKA